MYQFIIFITLLSLFLYISKQNYKRRASNISENLLQFKDEILRVYDALNSSEELTFLNSLSSKESYFFQGVKDNTLIFNTNINNLQTNMFIMESIMEKLKKAKNKGNH